MNAKIIEFTPRHSSETEVDSTDMPNSASVIAIDSLKKRNSSTQEQAPNKEDERF